MNRTPRRVRGLALLAATLLLPVLAHAVPVTFQVRMAQQIALGAFDPGADFVDLAGDFNGWGTDPLTPLADADGDSTYVVTLDGFTAGQSVEFKFRINGLWDGTEEFPGFGSNRVYTVLESGNLVDVWYNDFAPGGGEVEVGELHWWNDAVFYEILVRSFQDSDGDGIGDLPGLTSRLDYLNDGDPATTDDLGVTGLWLMPINDSPSYHGYDAVDYRAINPDYGTLADLQTFLAEAHARGIKVIVDYVMNHCSDQHPWFVASAQNHPTYRDWFRWSPTDPQQTGPWGQDVWHWNPSGWYYGLFWGGMPDLNYDTPAVKSEMFDTATWWLDVAGVDGFRLDAVLYIDEDGDALQTTPGTLQFWQDYNAHVKSVKPDVLSVGEAWTASSSVVQYVIDDRLDLCFEFDQSYALLGAVNGSDAGYLAGKAQQVYALYPYLQYATFLTNHDQDRVQNVLGFDAGKARAAAGLYLTLPGVPFVYYGEEIGMTGAGAHENIRTPMQWSPDANAGFTTGTPWHPVNGDYTTVNVADESADPGSLLEWYKRLIHLRNEEPALRRGTYRGLACSAPAVLAFQREYEGQTLLCLVNTSAAAQDGIVLTGDAESFAPWQEYQLVNLLDPSDQYVLHADENSNLSGLALAGHETAVYTLATITGADDLPASDLRLERAVPNPFNPSTTLRYSLAEPAEVRLVVYDTAGREIVVLQSGHRASGSHQAVWDGRNGRGETVGAGVYFVRLEAAGRTDRLKITLVK